MYMTIGCGKCRGWWRVYDDKLGNDSSKRCPACGSVISDHAWNDGVLRAFDAVKAANAALQAERGKAQGFSISFFNEYRK